jgi:Fe-S cluster assembly protein SufD
VWRYSRIADIDLGRYTPAPASAPERDVVPVVAAVASAVDAVVVRVVDGVPQVPELPESWEASGVTLASAADLDEGAAGLGAAAVDGPDVFATMNDAFTAAPVVLSVPRGVVLDRPVLVHHQIVTAGIAVFPRLVVRLADGAQATVIDHVSSTAGSAVLSVPLTELTVERAARLSYLNFQDLATDAWQVGSLVADVGQEANLTAGLVGLGGEYARLRTDCSLVGRGANGDLLAAYFGEADQTLDFRTFQRHGAPDTTSNLLFKGAVGGRSRSVYTGLIRVEKEARGTNAFQTNRNVKLSDTAWAESVPNLEIETNDVRCSHASTVGPVDPEQRFYLESRGVPPTVADRLIVAGFFGEVVRQMPGGAPVVDAIGARINDKLDRVEGDLR